MKTVEMKMCELRKISDFIDDSVIVILKKLDVDYEKLPNESIDMDKAKRDVDECYDKYVELLKNTRGLEYELDHIIRLHNRFKSDGFKSEIYPGEITHLLIDEHFSIMQIMFLETNEKRENNLKLFELFSKYITSLENVRRIELKK